MKNNITKKLIGYCPVDSGQIVLVDPCYIMPNKDGETKMTYEEMIEKREDEDLSNEILFVSIAGTGIVVNSGYGDGNYPVYAKIQNDRIKEVTIKFF